MKNEQVGLHQVIELLYGQGNDRVKRQPEEQEEALASYSLGRGLVSQIYKEARKLSTKRTKKSIP